MKGLFSVLVGFFIMGSCGIGAADDARYLGNENLHKYHLPTCVWAKRMSPKNCILFSSKDKAEKAGYIPCGECKP
jgi:micrococcal nuclease